MWEFSSPCLGILFSHELKLEYEYKFMAFSSSCLGILFSHETELNDFIAFDDDCFRPHVWGFFFYSRPGMSHGVGSL